MSEKIIEQFYIDLLNDPGKAARCHIPRSDVFYVREKYYQDTGHYVSLDRMERSMYLEGLLDAKDVLDPHRKRDWE